MFFLQLGSWLAYHISWNYFCQFWTNINKEVIKFNSYFGSAIILSFSLKVLGNVDLVFLLLIISLIRLHVDLRVVRLYFEEFIQILFYSLLDLCLLVWLKKIYVTYFWFSEKFKIIFLIHVFSFSRQFCISYLCLYP